MNHPVGLRLSIGIGAAIVALGGAHAGAGAYTAVHADAYPHAVTGAHTAAAVTATHAAAAQTGTIEGVIERPQRAARRTASRYAGAGAAAARTLQHVPVVVYLEGDVAGGRRPVERAEIAQVDTAFAPSVLVVPVGTAVAFPNRDPFFHNVFSFSPAQRFDLGRYPRGESKTVTFDRAGAVRIYCEVHQFMRSAVLVVENPHWAVVGDDGRFTLRDVPAGRHRLVVWDVDGRPQHVDVAVAAGAVARVQVALK